MATPTPAPDRKKSYLVGYNLVSAILWGAVLGRVLLVVPLVGTHAVYEATGEFAKWTQTLAFAEVGHAAFGESVFVCCGSCIYQDDRIERPLAILRGREAFTCQSFSELWASIAQNPWYTIPYHQMLTVVCYILTRPGPLARDHDRHPSRQPRPDRMGHCRPLSGPDAQPCVYDHVAGLERD